MSHFFSKLWHGQTSGITAAAFFIGAASIVSNVLGVVRDRLLASTFGAGSELDAYYAAFRLPDFLFYLLIVGAFTAGFIPLFTEYAERDGQEAVKRFTSQVFGWVGLVMALISGCLILLAPWIIPQIVHGFSPAATSLTITLTRIMFLSPIFLGLSAVMGGVLQATKRFFAFSLAPVVYNAGIIFGILVLAPRFGIVGVAWGVVGGAVLHFFIQWTVARRAGFGTVALPSLRHEGIGRLLKLTVPRFMSLAVSQINLVILLSLASSLTIGAVTVFNLANNIQTFPLSVFGISFALAAFPALSLAASRRDQPAFSQALNDAGRKIVFFILPTASFFILERVAIVSLILRSGKFQAGDVTRTADLLAWFALSLMAQALIPLLNRACFALQEVWKPFWISLVSEACNILLAYSLRGTFDIAGLAMAFSVASWVNVLLLWIVLRLKQSGLKTRGFWISTFKTGCATAALILGIVASERWMTGDIVHSSFFFVLRNVIVSGLMGGLAFVFVAELIRSTEWRELRSGVIHRLRR